MRIAAILIAVVLIGLAMPLGLRLESAVATRRIGRAVLEGGRLMLAIAAAAVLVLFAWRAQ